MLKKIMMTGFYGLVLLSCSDSGSDKPDVLAANMDSTQQPAQDFFSYANGGWIKKNPIPDAYSSWGIGNVVREDIYEKLKKINEDAVKNPEANTISQKIADFWTSGMDSTTIDQQGISPLKPWLEKIQGAENISSLLTYAGELTMYGPESFISASIGPDAKNSGQMAFYISQGGIGLPDRDYYFNTDQRTADVRQKYRDYLIQLFILMGNDAATAAVKASNCYDIERSFAQVSRKLEDLRDPYKNYHKVAVSALGQYGRNMPWQAWINAGGIKKLDSVIVGQPEFLVHLDKTLGKIPLTNWKDYLTLNIVRAFSPYLSSNFYDNHFNFYSKVISGAKKQRPRWKRVIDMEDALFGEALGQLFVKEYFTEKAKKRYSDLVEAIRTEMKERIEKLDWMSDSTKQKALYKLSKIEKKVGYPDKWKDFSSMKIGKEAYVVNIMMANKWLSAYNITKLYKPVDRTEWPMSPQTYNAGYTPTLNTIVLPAGIFIVPGYRDEELDDAVVYGYAGASTIGHELCHGFDDEGRQFDADGNLKNWWTKEDEAQFTKRAQVMVQQFDAFVAVDSLHVNGKATLGENIADFAGITLGWEAFKKTEQYQKGEKIAGLTPAQRFFMGYALGWLHHGRKEYLQQIVMSDVHAPAKFRVNGPFANFKPFYEAFGIKPGDAMYRPDSIRVKIW